MDNLSQRIVRLENLLLELKTASEINSSISLYATGTYTFTLRPTSRYFSVTYEDIEQAVFSKFSVVTDEWWIGVLPQLPIDNTQNFLLSIPEGLDAPVQARVSVASTIPVINVSLV